MVDLNEAQKSANGDIPLTAQKFGPWLDLHRAVMSPDVLQKAEFALLSLTWTKPKDIERYEVVRRIHERTLKEFADAWAAHTMG